MKRNVRSLLTLLLVLLLIIGVSIIPFPSDANQSPADSQKYVEIASGANN